MIECTRVDGYAANEPFRVEINGILQRKKNGSVRKFSSVLSGLEWAQRHLAKKARMDVTVRSV